MIVVIRDMSAGNAETGDAWQETKIFEETATLGEVMDWATGEFFNVGIEKVLPHTSQRITITRPHEDPPNK